MAWSNTTTHENMVLSYASTHKNMAWSDITIKKNISLVRYHNTQEYGLVRLPQHTRIQPERTSTTHKNMTGQIPQHINIYLIRHQNTPEYDLVRPPQHTQKWPGQIPRHTRICPGIITRLAIIKDVAIANYPELSGIIYLMSPSLKM